MMYKCIYCDYETPEICNFNRHKQSIKHNKIKNNITFLLDNKSKCRSGENNNPNNNPDNPNNNPKKKSNQVSDVHVELSNDSSNESLSGSSNDSSSKKVINLSCPFCKKTFKHNQNLWRHKKYRCKMINSSNQKDSSSQENEDKIKIKKLEEQLALTKNKLETTEDNLNKTLSILDNTSNTLNNTSTTLNNTSNTASKSMSTLNYVITNFSEAPPIKTLEGKRLDGFIEYRGETEKTIAEVIVYHYEKKKLQRLLGDLIIAEYKKSDKSKQSIWNTDVSRLTFILRQVIDNTKNTQWIVDKRGLDLIKLIIDPVVKKVAEILKDYIKNENIWINKIKQNDYSNSVQEIMKNKLRYMEIATIISQHINLKNLESEILRYIAPHFNLKAKNPEIMTDSESVITDHE